MFKRNGSAIDINRDLTIGEGDEAITIPSGSLQDAATRAQYGITEESDPVRADERYFWNGDLATPKDLDMLKAAAIDGIKTTANALLSQTSWYIERASDPSSGKAVPEEITNLRAAIRNACDANEAAIVAQMTVDALAGLALEWPAQ